jgi:hypothetical protein
LANLIYFRPVLFHALYLWLTKVAGGIKKGTRCRQKPESPNATRQSAMVRALPRSSRCPRRGGTAQRRAPIRRCRPRHTHQGAAPVVARGRGIHAVQQRQRQQGLGAHAAGVESPPEEADGEAEADGGRCLGAAMRPIDRVDLGRSRRLSAQSVPVSRGEDLVSFGRLLYAVGGGRCDGRPQQKQTWRRGNLREAVELGGQTV